MGIKFTIDVIIAFCDNSLVPRTITLTEVEPNIYTFTSRVIDIKMTFPDTMRVDLITFNHTNVLLYNEKLHGDTSKYCELMFRRCISVLNQYYWICRKSTGDPACLNWRYSNLTLFLRSCSLCVEKDTNWRGYTITVGNTVSIYHNKKLIHERDLSLDNYRLGTCIRNIISDGIAAQQD